MHIVKADLHSSIQGDAQLRAAPAKEHEKAFIDPFEF
jgi:hypothetical protein